MAKTSKAKNVETDKTLKEKAIDLDFVVAQAGAVPRGKDSENVMN